MSWAVAISGVAATAADASQEEPFSLVEYLINVAETITGQDLDGDGDVGVIGTAQPKGRVLRLRDGRAIKLSDEQAQQIDTFCDQLHELGIFSHGWDERKAGELLFGTLWDTKKALNGARLLSLPDPGKALAEDPKLCECFRKLHRRTG